MQDGREGLAGAMLGWGSVFYLRFFFCWDGAARAGADAYRRGGQVVAQGWGALELGLGLG